MREQTQDLIDEVQLERIAQLIEDAERVYFFEQEVLALLLVK